MMVEKSLFTLLDPKVFKVLTIRLLKLKLGKNNE